MTKRIFRNILLTSVLALLLTSALLVGTLYNVYESRISAELRTEAEYIVRALDTMDDDLSFLRGLTLNNRITLISPDGVVMYDSAADEARMDSHAERPEVSDALVTGTGESKRYSDTLSDITTYYARRTANGNVLRIASTRSTLVGLFLDVAPQIVVMMLMVAALSLLIARFSARQIVQPINELNLDEPLENDIYDELAPLLTRMDRQHMQIRQQMHDLARAHADLNAIMQNMREGLVLIDKSNRIISINGSAMKIFGVKGIIAPEADLLTICRESSIIEIVKEAQQGRASGSGHMCLSKTGKQRPKKDDGGAHGMHLLLRYSAIGHAGSVHSNSVSLPLYTAAQVTQNRNCRTHVTQNGTVGQLYSSMCQQASCQHRQYTVFGTLNCQRAFQRYTAPNM